jgi:hypothetical protein
MKSGSSSSGEEVSTFRLAARVFAQNSTLKSP